MLIDWFTVGAQIVNFLILIYLLKRFLYKPILRAMDEREQKIAGRLQEAAKKRDLAESEAASLAEERREMENSREKMREDARVEIEQWRDETMQQARNEVAETRRAWQENLEREQSDFVRRLKAVLSRQVFRAAAKAMEDLADERLEAKLVEKFNRQLPAAVADNEESGRRMGDELVIKSGFELNEQQHNELRAVVGKVFPEADVGFAVEPDIGFTIRLVGGNHRIEWGLNRYMDEMEEKVLSTMHLVQGKK